MKRTHKGKLLNTKWIETTTNAVCYTCKYHDWNTLNQASVVRVQTYENQTRNTYFCNEHALTAQAASTDR